MGFDERKTQHAGSAFDVNSSLICIEMTGGSVQALQLAAKRIRRLLRTYDNVLLQEHTCALLLPATPFSRAQELVKRVALLLTDVPCAMQVYHGTTALLILQHLYEAGATVLSSEVYVEIPSLVGKPEIPVEKKEHQPPSSSALPYLAFLANYPSPRLLDLFPYELACQYHCVPLGSERNMLTLATCQWLNYEVVMQLRSATHRGIFQVRCEISLIDEVLCYWRRLQETHVVERLVVKMGEAYSNPR